MSHPEHPSAIKSPLRLLITIILAFLIPIAIIIIMTNVLSPVIRSGAEPDPYAIEQVASRIQPVAGFKLVDADAPVSYKTGQQVFESTCSACHGSGVAGAPKFGDAGDWGKYIQQGFDSLLKNAIDGIGAMPPRGGNAALSDFEVARAVVYMTNHSGADFPEPAEPDADGATSEGPAPDTAAQATAPEGDAEQQAQAAAAETAAEDTAAGAETAATTQAAAARPASEMSVGEKLYQQICITCHDTGLAGAPKFGDPQAWAPYIETGLDAMLKNAISGVGAMPPRGGSQASDEELKAAIEYMIAAAQ
ncbi:cytochrome c5 family protein [Castellaniella sp.]|uniref:c-type cytochrome n=1 Tax=Castellaniella sp. TaxID=1955812 RepID=UPI00355DBE6F